MEDCVTTRDTFAKNDMLCFIQQDNLLSIVSTFNRSFISSLFKEQIESTIIYMSTSAC